MASVGQEMTGQLTGLDGALASKKLRRQSTAVLEQPVAQSSRDLLPNNQIQRRKPKLNRLQTEEAVKSTCFDEEALGEDTDWLVLTDKQMRTFIKSGLKKFNYRTKPVRQ